MSRPNYYKQSEKYIGGTGQKEFSEKQLLKLKINVPSLEEQHKISEFLSLVDKKIELMEKKYEKVIQFKKSILEKIFKKELNFKNNEWITIKLKDIGQFYRGHSYNSSNVTQRGLLVLRSNNIKNNKISLSEQLQFVNKDCKEELKLKKGDIVICMSNGYCTKEKLGNCNDCPAKPESAWSYMSNLAKKYLKDEYEFKYEGSLFSMKPILKASEIDDSRPTVIKQFSTNPTFVSVLSGKVNTVFDLDEVLKND